MPDSANGFFTQLLSLYRRFTETKNISLAEMLVETGYLERYGEVSMEAIVPIIKDNPSYVEDWIEYSENKRTNRGWYIKPESSQYVVGCIEKLGEGQSRFFANKEEACSYFVIHELADIRTQLLHTRH